MRFNKLATNKSQKDNGLTAKQMALGSLLTVTLAAVATFGSFNSNQKVQSPQVATQSSQSVQQESFEIPYSPEMGIDNYSHIQDAATLAIISQEFNGNANKYIDAARVQMAKNGITDEDNTKADVHVTMTSTLMLALSLQEMDNTGNTYKEALPHAISTTSNYQMAAYNAYKNTLVDTYNANRLNQNDKDLDSSMSARPVPPAKIKYLLPVNGKGEVINVSMDQLYKKMDQNGLNKVNAPAKKATVKL